MPSACNYTWSAEIDAAIQDRANAYGLPWDLAYAFIAAESGFDPYVSGDTIGSNILGFNDSPSNGHQVFGPDGHKGLQFPNGYIAWESYRTPGRYDWSHGLLQLQTGGGQGSVSPGVSRTWTELVNPWTNLNIGLPHIADAFRFCWSPNISPINYIYCIMVNSGHPGNVAFNDPVVNRVFSIWQCFYDVLVGGGFIPAPTPPPSPTPPLPDPVPPLPEPVFPSTISAETIAFAAAGLAVVGVFIMALRRPIILKKTYSPSGSVLSKKLLK